MYRPLILMNTSSMTYVYSLRTSFEHQRLTWRSDINVAWSDISTHSATRSIGLYESASVFLAILNWNTNWYNLSVMYQQNKDSMDEIQCSLQLASME